MVADTLRFKHQASLEKECESQVVREVIQTNNFCFIDKSDSNIKIQEMH